MRIVDGAARPSPLDETFVIDRLDSQNMRGMHRHYLRAAWMLWETHGDHANFLLDQPPWARGHIADQVFQSQRIFNSVGIVQLVLRLYTDGARPKRGFQGRAGGLAHLLRVLDQLERTHDVYGMTPEAVVRILPPEFTPWVNGADFGTGATADAGPAGPDREERARREGAASTADDGRSPGADDASAPDPKLRQWEALVRRTGRGTMRYKGFRAIVRIDETDGALTGTVVNPESRPIGTVSAMEAGEFKRTVRRTVDDCLARER